MVVPYERTGESVRVAMGAAVTTLNSSTWTYPNWSLLKSNYTSGLNTYNYSSPSSDILKYAGCISFEDSEPLTSPPCYSVSFTAKDNELRRQVVEKIKAAKDKLGFMEGPVSLFVYRDYNSLGNGNAWWNANRSKQPLLKLRAIPLNVILLFPSITVDGDPAPNYAFIGKTHRWITDFVYVPQSSSTVWSKSQCYTYCQDENGKFFPCGCSWKGECDINLKVVQKRSLFFAAYNLDMKNSVMSALFANSKYREYQLNILPMELNMYNNCRYALMSKNRRFAFDIKLNEARVYQKTAAGMDFRDICRQGEHDKYNYIVCIDENELCKGLTANADAITQNVKNPANGWRPFYKFAFRRPCKGAAYFVLEETTMKVVSHLDQEVVWERSFEKIPAANRVMPLAIVLEDDGELVLYNGLNQRVAFSVSGIGENKAERAVNEDDAQMMSTLNLNHQKQSQHEAENAMLNDLMELRKKGKNDVCQAPPFAFLS